MLSVNFLVQALLVFLTSLMLTPVVRAAAIRYKLFDHVNERKIHSGSIPRIGGIAIFVSFLLPVLLSSNLDRPAIALILGCLLLFVMGLVDDLRGLNPYIKLGVQIVACLIVLAGGIGIVNISVPFVGGPIQLDTWRIPITVLGGSYTIIPLANLFTIGWIILVINALNLLDGLDGLASGVSAVALVTLLALTGRGFGNEIVVIMATFMLMSLLGFLASNFHPARIFMGDSGAYVLGLLIAVLPIYSTTKTTIGLLVIGLAVIDLLWAIVRRTSKGKSPFTPDRGHLHHRLIDSGLRHVDAVLVFYFVAIVTSLSLLFIGVNAAIVFLILSAVTILLATKASQ